MLQLQPTRFPVPESEIAFFNIEYKICYLYSTSGRRHPLNTTLEFLELILDPKLFYRANRKTILKKEATVRYTPISSRKLIVETVVPSNQPITIPKAKVSRFKKWLRAAAM